VSTLICRWCKLSNVKSVGPNVQCFDCGRMGETRVYAPEAVGEPEPAAAPESVVEPEPEPDQTPEEAEEAAALAAEIEAEEQAKKAVKPKSSKA
jgi:hypothetical protein